jgi:hypothetical protein
VVTLGLDAACRLFRNMLPTGTFAKLFDGLMKLLGVESMQTSISDFLKGILAKFVDKIPGKA